ncbi:GNAT family protein [Paenibacillus puerhi]|uniref:GNAT family N-acetyltransferase n=1 Tax=Paenibacillus puerhi TaxID=2692622 RepID=UPI00135C53CD|nr:GNAT family N-acetyltransferase [Paenibacillus puerhi]
MTGSLSGTAALYDGRKERIPWPDDEQGRYAQRYLQPILEQPVSSYITNIDTSLRVLGLCGHTVPVTVNSTEYDSSYVCSPYTHYVTYAKEELRLAGFRGLRPPLSALLDTMGVMLKMSGINRVVQVNNWLLSTNLYPAIPEAAWEQAVSLLLDAYPSHALIFRSLNRTLNGPLIERLVSHGFRLVPSRQIYLLKPSDDASVSAKARWLVKRDYKLLSKHGYERLEPSALTPADIPRLTELYRALYVEKYSACNPQFTERFFAMALEQGLLQLHALRSIRTGRIDGVLGFFQREGVMTTPVFGYDTSLPQSLGLYRMLSAVLLELARANGCLLHESSGAAQFKRNRGAWAEIEYSAVYDRHLPIRRQLGWAMLGSVLNGLGVPFIQKYKL